MCHFSDLGIRSQCGTQTRGINITWEHVGKAPSRAPAWTSSNRNWGCGRNLCLSQPSGGVRCCLRVTPPKVTYEDAGPLPLT